MTSGSLARTPARLILPALRSEALSGFAHEAGRIADALEIGVGGFIIFGGTAESVRRLTSDLLRRAGRPLLLAADLERGAGQQIAGLTEFPPPLALASLNDPAVVRWAAAVTAQEARAVGINWIFAPVADLDVLADNPIVQTRAFGDDPNAVATCVRHWIEGCQAAGALACAKHYPGHGRTSVDSHIALPVVEAPASALRGADLLPFTVAIESGVASIMTAHVAYPTLDDSNLPATLSRRLLGELRTKSRFDGLVVTDALIMDGALSGRRESDAAVQAIQAGADLLLYPNDPRRVRDALEAALASGNLEAQRLDESLARYVRALSAATGPTPPVTRGPYESAEGLADALLRKGMVRGSAPGLTPPLDLVVVDDDVGGALCAEPERLRPSRARIRIDWPLLRRVEGGHGVRRAAGMERALQPGGRLPRSAGTSRHRSGPHHSLWSSATPERVARACTSRARVASAAADAGSRGAVAARLHHERVSRLNRGIRANAGSPMKKVKRK